MSATAQPQNTALADTTADGAFKRTAAVFRDQVTADGEYKPEAGRYLLYVSLVCPWANRCLAVLRLKGLTQAIDVCTVHPVWARTRPDDADDTHCGWQFRRESDAPVSNPAGLGSFPCDGCTPDPVFDARYLRDVYEKCGAPPGARYTVPVLFDKASKRIVNNESSEIIRILNSAFNAIAEHPEVDLYPASLRGTIDEVNAWTYSDINNGVYRCGFATTQAAYEEAFHALTAALDRCEKLLGTQRYLAGSQLTEADIRLFMTLVRYDEVYVVYFKTNGRMIRELPNVSNYVRDLFQVPAIGGSINMQHIKRHYFASHPVLNAHAIVPVGQPHDFLAPHDRARFDTVIA